MLGAGNRRIGGALALAAEIWLRLGRPIETGQALYRDARWVDRSTYDLEALAREGNLGVLPLDPLSREIVAEYEEAGESERLAQLLQSIWRRRRTPATAEPRRMSDVQTLSELISSCSSPCSPPCPPPPRGR